MNGSDRLRRCALFLHATVLLVAIGIGRGVAPRATMRRVTTFRARATRTGALHPGLPEDIVIATVERAAQLIPHAENCLVLSLTAQILLARHGHDSALAVGLDPLDAHGSAHAWLERDGAVLVGNFPGLRRHVRVRLPDLQHLDLSRSDGRDSEIAG